MLHVLEDHDERITITTHAIKLDDVLMLQVGEQLCFPLEILAGCQGGVFQRLKERAQIHTGWAQVWEKPEQRGSQHRRRADEEGTGEEPLPPARLHSAGWW